MVSVILPSSRWVLVPCGKCMRLPFKFQGGARRCAAWSVRHHAPCSASASQVRCPCVLVLAQDPFQFLQTLFDWAHGACGGDGLSARSAVTKEGNHILIDSAKLYSMGTCAACSDLIAC